MEARTITASESVVLHVVGGVDSSSRLLRDVARSRELLVVLARQNFKGRYRSASLGLAWSVLLPLIQGAILSFVFSQFVRIETEEAYPAFVMTGMVTWSFISSGVNTATTSIVDTAGLAGKVYFPRLLLPMMPVAAALPSFGLAVLVAVAIALIFGDGLSWSVLLLPITMAFTAWVIFAITSITSIMHVYSRDVRYVVQASMMVLLYATPVIYPMSVAGDYEWILQINPFTGPLEAMRGAVFGFGAVSWPAIGISIGWSVLLTTIGVFVFGRHDRLVSDRL